jgi:hypothetical protein
LKGHSYFSFFRNSLIARGSSTDRALSAVQRGQTVGVAISQIKDLREKGK